MSVILVNVSTWPRRYEFMYIYLQDMFIFFNAVFCITYDSKVSYISCQFSLMRDAT